MGNLLSQRKIEIEKAISLLYDVDNKRPFKKDEWIDATFGLIGILNCICFAKVSNFLGQRSWFDNKFLHALDNLKNDRPTYKSLIAQAFWLIIIERDEQSLEVLNKAIKVNSTGHEAYFLRSLIKANPKSLDDANKAVKLKPNSTYVYNLSKHMKNNSTKELRWIDEAINLNPLNYCAHNSKFNVLFENGNTNESIEALNIYFKILTSNEQDLNYSGDDGVFNRKRKGLSENILLKANELYAANKFCEAFSFFDFYINKIWKPADRYSEGFEFSEDFKKYIYSLLITQFPQFSLSDEFYLYSSFHEWYMKMFKKPIKIIQRELKKLIEEIQSKKNLKKIFQRELKKSKEELLQCKRSIFYQTYVQAELGFILQNRKYINLQHIDYPMFPTEYRRRSGKLEITTPNKTWLCGEEISVDELLLKIINENNLVIDPAFFSEEILRKSNLYNVAVLYNTVKHQLLVEECIIDNYYKGLLGQSIKNGNLEEAYTCICVLLMLNIYIDQKKLKKFYKLYLYKNNIVLNKISKSALYKKYDAVFKDFKVYCNKANESNSTVFESYMKDQNSKEVHILRLNGIGYNLKLYFGKYKGDYVSSVYKKDPEYILWCIINLHHFYIEPTEFVKHELLNYKNSAKAVAINLIKEALHTKWYDVIENALDYDDYTSYSDSDNDSSFGHPSYEEGFW